MKVNKIRYLGLLPEVTTQAIKDATIDDIYKDPALKILYTYGINVQRFDVWRYNPPKAHDGLYMCSSSEELLQIILMLNLGIPIEEIIHD